VVTPLNGKMFANMFIAIVKTTAKTFMI
jgi:hypothetical protein